MSDAVPIPPSVMNSWSIVWGGPKRPSTMSPASWVPRAMTADAPPARNPAAKLSTRSTATVWVGWGWPGSLLPLA